jgi:amidohydrolase
MLSSSQTESLILLRHDLHAQPELSGDEVNTKARLINYIEGAAPHVKILEAGRGFIAVFQSTKPGPTTMIRAELDALPIQEVNDVLYKSRVDGVSHKCGHDGHMTIVAGLAHLLAEQPPERGKVVLLFQSAEETGQGARWMLEDPAFIGLKPDYAFALHNLPGRPMHEISCKSGVFCPASTGLKIILHGKTAHASSPQTGISPVKAVSLLSKALNEITSENDFSDFVLLTITHIQVGEQSFGVSPGSAELWLTIRAHQDDDLTKLRTLVEGAVSSIGSEEGLSFEVSGHESFAATLNDFEAVNMVKAAAQKSRLNFNEMTHPNPWSEDFGGFLRQSKGAMFGLGSGIDQPALHNPDYDFPDELIETGIRMFWGLIQKLNY